MSTTVETNQLQRVLGRKELLSIAVGQIIGGGIMAMIGAAIGMTGKSVVLAFLLSSFMTLILAIPVIFLGGTVRIKGGQYSQAVLLAGKMFSGVYMVIFIFANISIAMYAISFAEYFLALIPGIPVTLLAALVLTLFYLANLRGIEGAAKIQNLLIILLLGAIVTFIAFGVGKVQPGFFEVSSPDFMVNGPLGILTTASYLTFATGGATVVINFSAEAKKPTKDIPIVIIVSTVGVAILYAFMAYVASGVLPIEDVMNKPLTLVAQAIMPQPFYIFFIVCGAMIALATTLNATLAWVTKPILQACKDGWFPTKLAKLNNKNVPSTILTGFYLIGLIPILLKFDISFIGSFAVILNLCFTTVLCLATMKMPKVFPQAWAKSKFKVPNIVLNLTCILSAVVAIVQIVMLTGTMSTNQLMGIGAILVIAIVYPIIRNKCAQVKIDVDYEEA